jgi:hypothetical protein
MHHAWFYLIVHLWIKIIINKCVINKMLMDT